MPEIAEKKEDFKFKQLGIVCVQYMCLWGGGRWKSSVTQEKILSLAGNQPHVGVVATACREERRKIGRNRKSHMFIVLTQRRLTASRQIKWE